MLEGPERQLDVSVVFAITNYMLNDAFLIPKDYAAIYWKFICVYWI